MARDLPETDLTAHPFDAASIAARMAEALAGPGQPDPAYRAIDEITAEILGHSLFTVLAFVEKDGEVERMYTSRPEEYPLRGRKKMGPTPWGDHVLKGGRSWFGAGAEDIRWAFPDAELILSLGCEHCLCAPVRHDGRTLGLISVLGPDGAYGEGDLALVEMLTPYLIPALTPQS